MYCEKESVYILHYTKSVVYVLVNKESVCNSGTPYPLPWKPKLRKILSRPALRNESTALTVHGRLLPQKANVNCTLCVCVCVCVCVCTLYMHHLCLRVCQLDVQTACVYSRCVCVCVWGMCWQPCWQPKGSTVNTRATFLVKLFLWVLVSSKMAAFKKTHPDFARNIQHQLLNPKLSLQALFWVIWGSCPIIEDH